MPSLSDKLKALGVKLGADELQPRRGIPNLHTIETVLGGAPLATPVGDTFVVEELIPTGRLHGDTRLEITAPREQLAAWAGDSRVTAEPDQSFAFIDTETTGLSGGTGTYAFLIGVGRFIEGAFQLNQFFLRDPAEEPAQLFALEAFLAPCEILVSYNGKAFDIPLLSTRFFSHGLQPHLLNYAHIDLLHLARRLWRDRLPSRTLGNIEYSILHTRRSEDDVPGWKIPQLYFDYLRSGDARPLKSVFYHNAMDVISLAALLNHSAMVLHDPLQSAQEHGVDLLSLAKLYEDLRDLPRAIELYLHGLSHSDAYSGSMPKQIYLQALQRLALIYKRRGDYHQAIHLWEQAAHHHDPNAMLELAKYYEHIAKDIDQALSWTEYAIIHISQFTNSHYEQERWAKELAHRQNRLINKADNRKTEQG